MQDAIVILVVSWMLAGSASSSVAPAKVDANQPIPAKADSNQPAPPAVRNPQSDITASTQIIKSIEFLGNENFKDHVLRQRLGFELGDRLDPFLAEGGRLTIAEVYRKIGYAFVEVSLDKEKASRGNLLYTIVEGPRVQVNCIQFVGNEEYGSGTLKEIIKTTTKQWLFWPTYYTEDAIEEDVGRLRDFYYDHGFLNYKIAAEKEFSDDHETVCITFTISEGPAYLIGDIVVTGNARYTTEELMTKIDSRVNKVYLRPTARRDALAIAQLYREQGYVDADVRQSVVMAPQPGNEVVTLKFEVTEGRPFRIGRVEITGNERVQDKAVRHVLDEYGFTPGELYNARLAPKEGGGLLEKLVQRGTVSEEAMIRPVVPLSGDPNQKDVRVDIKEGMTGLFMPSVGVSSDSGIFGRIVLSQNNFDYTDTPENFWDLVTLQAFRGAGQTLSLVLEPGTEYSQYSVDWTNPYWLDRPMSLDLRGTSYQRFRESWDESRLRGFVGVEKRLPNKWRPSVGVRAETVRIYRLDYDVAQEIRDEAGHNQLYGLKLGLERPDIDDPYNPGRGTVLGTDYEQVAGDFDFGVLSARYTQYWTLHEDVLGRKTVLAGRIMGATTVGDAPTFEKFYAGGSQTSYPLRGFEYRGISPRGLQTNVAHPRRKDPIGSDQIFLAGAETTVPLIGDNFSLLFFSDSGTVETGKYRLSVGTGLQITVPQLLGQIPMRFELAAPLLKDDEDRTQVFSFSMGGMLPF
jgi:outer membrane protein insertion porin family